MYKLFLCVILFFMSVSTAFAAEATTGPNPCANIAEATRNLGSQEIATLLESCRSPAKSVAEKLADPETANEWGTAAKSFAVAIGIAAKELGIATNDFLKSPAGFLLAAVLIFKFCGGILIGVPFMVFTMWFCYRTINKYRQKDAEYVAVSYFWGLYVRQKAVNIKYSPWEEGSVFFTLIVLLTGLIANGFVWHAL
jgi:hypothetical protein